MRLPTYILILSGVMTTEAVSQSIIDELCGAGHVNETAVAGSVSENPDGYYLAGLKTQLSNGDPRIIRAVGSDFYVCTRPASTPEADVTQMHLSANRRVVAYLFVPNTGYDTDPNS